MLDPFCGPKTALLKAAVAGVPAIGVDTNLLVVLLSKVKAAPPREDLAPVAAEVGRAARDRIA
ncbi:MAG: hypothetical protein BRD48_01245 [Bacteroidetes bacterium QS_9_68_14]|nr:MAG: hypothetical protein BRD48_01245 [Bacteroidetes bacterium QS_9_68_14]